MSWDTGYFPTIKLHTHDSVLYLHGEEMITQLNKLYFSLTEIYRAYGNDDTELIFNIII